MNRTYKVLRMLLAVRMLLTVHFAILVVTHRNIPRDMLIGTLSPIQKNMR